MTANLFIVDDDEVDRYLIARIAAKSQLDINIREFSSGHEFLDSLANSDSDVRQCLAARLPVLIFIDINMPVMTGFELVDACCHVIEQENVVADLMSVLICSSSDHPQDRNAAEQRELICGYVVKPPTTERLEELISLYC